MLVVYGGNDYLIERAMRSKVLATGAKGPAAGLVGGLGFLSATLGGEAIHASLEQPLTERTGNPGRYFCVLDAADLTDNLAEFDGLVIWECVRFPGDYEAWMKVRYKAIRPLVV